jgi:hypothetical protein
MAGGATGAMAPWPPVESPLLRCRLHELCGFLSFGTEKATNFSFSVAIKHVIIIIIIIIKLHVLRPQVA